MPPRAPEKEEQTSQRKGASPDQESVSVKGGRRLGGTRGKFPKGEAEGSDGRCPGIMSDMISGAKGSLAIKEEGKRYVMTRKREVT